MTDAGTVGDILDKIRKGMPGIDVRVMVGRSADDVLQKLSEDGDAAEPIRILDMDTIVSDWRISPGSNTILITVDDSTDRNDPNVSRFMEKGLTYAQAKVMHLRSLNYTQERIAEIEQTTRSAINEREKLANKKLLGVILYKRC